MSRYCKGNATSPKRLSYHGQGLISDGCLSSGCYNCKKYKQRPVQDYEMVTNWSGGVMGVVIKVCFHTLVAIVIMGPN